MSKNKKREIFYTWGLIKRLQSLNFIDLDWVIEKMVEGSDKKEDTTKSSNYGGTECDSGQYLPSLSGH